MKALLAVLGAISTTIPSSIVPVHLITNHHKSTTLEQIWSAPTSMEELVKSVRRFYQDGRPPTAWIDPLEEAVAINYQNLVNNKVSVLDTLSLTPMNEKIERTFQDIYQNDTPNPQTFQTQSYSIQVANTSTFTSSISESIAINVSTSFIFFDASISANLSSTQSWTKSTTVTETITAPSQSFTVNPYSIGVADYTIKSGSYNTKGLLRTYVALNDLVTTGKFAGSSGITHSAYYVKDIVKWLNEAGYGDYLRMDSEKFSIISADNPNNPTVIAFNIPISWVSQGGKMEVKLSEKPLENKLLFS